MPSSETPCQSPIKLIISARDPATAHSLDKIITVCEQDPRFIIQVLAQQPAAEILQKVHPDFQIIEKNSLKNLETILQQWCDEFQPDAVLTGISGPDVGIDEVLIKIANHRSIKSYALQSFWGDINQASQAIPHSAFVLDDEAIKLTQQRYPEVRCIPIGSIKHAEFKAHDALMMRKELRKSRNIENKIVLSFYGQPLEEVAGYFETIQTMVDALKLWDKEFVLMYRPHPKEPKTLFLRTLTLFNNELKQQVCVDNDPCIVSSLVQSDIVISGFSTCGFDNLYLNEMANKPFNSSVYLWFNDEMIQWWQTYSGLEQMPLVDEGLVLCPSSDTQDILATFEKALSKEIQQALRLRAKEHLPDPAHAVNRVVETLLEDLL